MLQDFEGLTKQSIEFENERAQLEGTIDQLREKIEALEITLGEERVRMLGSRGLSSSSNAEFTPPRNGGESMSTQLLKTEFKKMIRDMKAEQMKALRVSLDMFLGEFRLLSLFLSKMLLRTSLVIIIPLFPNAPQIPDPVCPN